MPASSANLGPGFDSIAWRSGCGTPAWPPAHRGRGRGGGRRRVTPPTSSTARCCAPGRGLGAVAPGRAAPAVPQRGAARTWPWLVRHGDRHGNRCGTGLARRMPRCRGPGRPRLHQHAGGQLEGHPDNSSASVYGGLTLSWSDGDGDGTHTVRLAPPRRRRPRALVPATSWTAKARWSCRPTCGSRGRRPQLRRSALLVQALTAHPEHLLAGTREWLHQEARRESLGGSWTRRPTAGRRARRRHLGRGAVGAGPVDARRGGLCRRPRADAAWAGSRPGGFRVRGAGQRAGALGDNLDTLVRRGIGVTLSTHSPPMRPPFAERPASCTLHMTAAFAALASLCCMWLHRSAVADPRTGCWGSHTGGRILRDRHHHSRDCAVAGREAAPFPAP